MGKRRRCHRQRRGKKFRVGWIIFFITGLLILGAVAEPKIQSSVLTHVAGIIIGIALILFALSLFVGMLPWIVAIFGASLMFTSAPFLGLVAILLGVMLFFWMARPG
jgi:hypothetical protein